MAAFPRLIKWTGSKYTEAPAILKAILPRLPAGGSWWEPFAGSAAVSGALVEAGYRGAFCLTDANPHLVALLRSVRDSPDALYDAYLELVLRHGGLFDVEDFDLAKSMLDSGDEVAQGAAFLYLNRTSFNGLYRTNRAGRFNAPPARDRIGKEVPRVDREAIVFWHLALRRADILHMGWKEDLVLRYRLNAVFLDPPYEGTFTSYTKEGAVDMAALHEAARAWADRGVTVVATLPDTEALLAPWREWCDVEPLARRTMVGAKTTGKTPPLKQVLLVSR